jgi:hypothetical protein
MSTKTQRFRTEMQRAANPPKPKQPARPRRDTPVDTAQPGVSATDRKAGGGSTAARNASARAGKKGGARLEDSASGRPSRKSTRKSKGRVKRTTSLQIRESARTHSPKARKKKR